MIKVTCSCGDTTNLKFDNSLMDRHGNPGGRYVPDNPKWKFKTNTDLSIKIGWTCGKRNHYQAKP